MIDIIVPTYNSQSTIKRCINSILRINSIKYFLIIVDDGSTDKTPFICSIYSNKYSNICFVRQNNKGVSSARNNGLKHAHSHWVCFVDSDDYIDPVNFVKVIKLYLSSNVDLIVSNFNYNKKKIGLKKHKYVSLDVKHFVEFNYPLYGNMLIHVTWNKIYNNDIIRKQKLQFPKDINMGEDLIFVLKYLKFIKKKVIQTRISYYNYCIHNNSLTGSFEKNAISSRTKILKEILDIYKKYNLPLNKLNPLKLKAIYSILLNGLNNSGRKIIYINNEKIKMINDTNLFNFIPYEEHISIKDKLLLLLLKQSSIYILFYFLYFINIIRKIKQILTKY